VAERAVDLAPVSWAMLAPESRSLTVPLDGRLYARLGREARARGLSMRELVRGVLAEALADDGQGGELAPVAASYDVPLFPVDGA
jgi:hypothetical protein